MKFLRRDLGSKFFRWDFIYSGSMGKMLSLTSTFKISKKVIFKKKGMKDVRVGVLGFL